MDDSPATRPRETDERNSVDMSETQTDDGRPVLTGTDCLRADIAEREHGPDECTIWPHNASGNALLTEWITAEEGSFVSLEEMR